jgi:hypothetical protein
MPLNTNQPRVRGIAAQTPERTVFESGDPRMDTSAADSAGQTIVTPGNVAIGEQVRIRDASTLLAGILQGSATGLSSLSQGWVEGERRLSADAFNRLRRGAQGLKASGADASTVASWLSSQNFVPDSWNQDAYAQLNAEIHGQSIDQWEGEDLLREQTEFSNAMLTSPTTMGLTGQRNYLKSRSERSANRKVRDWAARSIGALNAQEAEDALVLARSAQAIRWNENTSAVETDPVAMTVLANHPHSARLAMAVATGAVRWSPERRQFEGNLPDSPVITPGTEEEVIIGMLAAHSDGVPQDTETLKMLTSAGMAFTERASTVANQLSSQMRSQVAAGMMERAADVPPQDLIRAKLADPQLAGLRPVPGEPEDVRRSKQIATNSVIADIFRVRGDQVLKKNQHLPLAARLESAAPEIPYMPETAHLFTNGKPNDGYDSVLREIRQDMRSMLVVSAAEETSLELESLGAQAKAGNPNSPAMRKRANHAMISLTRLYTGSEPEVRDGVVTLSPADMTTAQGKAVMQAHLQYQQTLAEITTVDATWRILNNPDSTSPAVVGSTLDKMADDQSYIFGTIEGELESSRNPEVLIGASGNLTRILAARGDNAGMPPKVKGWLVSQFSDSARPDRLLVGMTVMSGLQGTAAFHDVYAEMNPSQRLMALAGLDAVQSTAFAGLLASNIKIQSSDRLTDEQKAEANRSLIDQMTLPVRDLVSRMGDVPATSLAKSLAAFNEHFAEYDSPSSRARTDPMIQGFFDHTTPLVVDGLKSLGDPVLSENPEQILSELAASPETSLILQELYARAYVATADGTELTPTEWAQISHLTFGGPRTVYRDGSTLRVLYDPNRHFGTDIMDRLDIAWNMDGTMLGPESAQNLNRFKGSLRQAIDEHSETRGFGLSALDGRSSLNDYAKAYAKAIGLPEVPGLRYAFRPAPHPELQASLMDSTESGVPLVLAGYVGDELREIHPVTPLSGSSRFLVSRNWVPETVKRTRPVTRVPDALGRSKL